MTATAADLQTEYRRLRDEDRETGQKRMQTVAAYSAWVHQCCLDGHPPDALRRNAGTESERFFARTIPGTDDHTYWDGNIEHFRLDTGRVRHARWWWYERVNGPQEKRGRLGAVCGEMNCITPDHQQFVPWSEYRRRYTDEQMLGALQVAAQRLGHAPSRDEYRDLGLKPSREIIRIRFSGWTNAVLAAGLTPAAAQQHRSVATPEQCFASLRFVADLLGHAPSESEFRAHNLELQAAGLHSSPSTIYRCIGSWPKALQLAGLTNAGAEIPEAVQPTKGSRSFVA